MKPPIHFLLSLVYFKRLIQIILKCKEEYLSVVTEDKDKVNARCGGSYYEVKAVVEVTTR